MLVHYGALERTEEEYRVLLEAAGFTLERLILTQAPLSIMRVYPCKRGGSHVMRTVELASPRAPLGRV